MDDCRDDRFLRDDSLDEDVFTSILFAWAPLRPLIPGQFSVFSLCRGALAYREPTRSFVKDVACHAKSWTITFFLEPHYEGAL